ncbi:hypothetical protein G3I01_02870 [Gramella sp. MT6]|uniref:hypothetical protein n=1 Tax=Gramella sp. MT6 TaxID=2705471 RepID=UPI001C5F6044|nr:hypothetical protein [Gramella sp. MT6]QYA24493.1 hypothetical protein G3I01_02870 [Gramella sp. MT6]
MKVKSTVFVLFFCMPFLNVTLSAQEVNKMVVLEVDTDNINANNINEMATFGQPSEISNENFTLDVQLGDVIIWQGRTMPGTGGLVRIKLLKHEEGVKLLGANRISEQDGTGVVVGRVQAGQVGDEEKYSLKFEVRQRGSQDWVEYTIDPKLQLMPQE